MWQYMGLANPIQNRLHYTDETIAGAFSASDPGAIASAASPDPRQAGRPGIRGADPERPQASSTVSSVR